ncbi:MAG TPA: efflux RND transporter periplasmic adaptor subunit [Phycisphaerae bacterium]|jgi:RND family efflux transporter MFP subunit
MTSHDSTATLPEPSKAAPPSPSNGQSHAAAASPAEHAHAEDEIPHDLHRPRAWMLILIVILFIGALVGLFFVGWYPHEAEHAQASADAQEQRSFIPTVSVAAPRHDNASHELVLPCDIRPNQETLIYPRGTGYLKKLYVDIQDHVEAGQLLAEIDAPEVDAQLAQARASQVQSQADVTKAQADLDLAQRTLDRFQDVTSASVSQQEKDEKRTARDQAAAALEQAKANVIAAEANVQRLVVMQSFQKITAPFSGTITARNYDVGALLSAGSTSGRELFRLTQATTLRIFISVPQVESSEVKAGQEASLTVRNFPGKTFNGTVARVAGAIDPNTRTMPFELHFANPSNELYSGMYGEVRLVVTEAKPATLIPTSAMVFDAGGTQVALVRNGKVHFQKISIGRDMGTELEVTDGLAADDSVIINPGERLVEGVEVNVFNNKPQTADQRPIPH